MINSKNDISHPALETERLILRPFQEDNLEDLYRYTSIEGVGKKPNGNITITAMGIEKQSKAYILNNPHR